MEMMISRMAAKDGFSFNSFWKSSDLRYLFHKSGHKLPLSSNTIKSIVLQFSEFVKTNMINEIQKLQNTKYKIKNFR